MWVEKVVQASLPLLKGKKIKDVVAGLALTAVELDSGEVGVAYVLREDLPHGCAAFSSIWQDLVGTDAQEAAKLFYNGENVLMHAIGAAVVNAAANNLRLPPDSKKGNPFGLEINADDKIAMVGLISPVAKQLYKITPHLYIFDMNIPDEEGLPKLSRIEDQKNILPECDIVILSGTTTLNGTIDSLLDMCEKAREVVMVGQSTPMIAEGWKGSRITRLAGSTWKAGCKEDIFRQISRGGGTASILPYAIYNRVDL